MACTVVSSFTFSGISSSPLATQRHSSLQTQPASLHSKLPSLAAPKSSKAAASNGGSRLTMSVGSDKQHSLPNLAALALMTAMVVPEMAEAVAPGVSPSLKNLLLSVVAGGVVLAVIGVAVAGVSTFDPVKRS